MCPTLTTALNILYVQPLSQHIVMREILLFFEKSNRYIIKRIFLRSQIQS